MVFHNGSNALIQELDLSEFAEMDNLASSQNYLKFILGQLSGLNDTSYRAMMSCLRQKQKEKWKSYFAKQPHCIVYKNKLCLMQEPSITAGIFASIAAWANHQRSEDETPYWGTLKENGELNAE